MPSIGSIASGDVAEHISQYSFDESAVALRFDVENTLLEILCPFGEYV
jgi:hypothetical protein